MKIKRYAAAALAAGIALSACACSDGQTGQEADTNSQEQTTSQEETEMTPEKVELKEENFKELGRTYYDNGMIYCALSGTGVEFSFTGTKCSVTVAGDNASGNSSGEDAHARIGIYVNGERVIDDMIDNAIETYDVFDSESEETVDIKIVKLSEAPHSTYAITDISIVGKNLKPAEDKDRLIEFVGDSITCGYGVDDEDKTHNFSTKTEDCTKAYAYKTAETLDADYSLVSFSGYGIISGYSDGETKVSQQTVPQYYTKLGYSWSGNGSFVPSDIDWDFSKRQPDVIVINLGTNDDSYCKGQAERCEEYQSTYVEFLKTVRENNPDSEIIASLGTMGQALCPYVEAAVKQYSEETGDEKIHYLMFDQQNPRDGLAADWHPTEKTHTKSAEKLSETIKEIMGW